ncbi:MAG: Pyruvate carboxyltransferase protein [Deltaproteobacteria bacterium]|nr:Pyruvate carboxyltransferase protein [Deltaproteobacteria bacterium]
MAKPIIPGAQLAALHAALDKIRVAPAYRSGQWFVGPVNFAPEVRAAMTLPARVEICDVTLREASQAYFGEREYLALARALDEAGVAVIQFLAPKTGGDREQAVRVLNQLSKMKLRAKLQLYGVGSAAQMDLARDHGVEIISYTIFPLPEWQPIYAASRNGGDSSDAGAQSAAPDSEAKLMDYVEGTAAAIKTRGMKPRPIANFFSMASVDFLRNLGRTCERIGVYALNFVDAAGSMGPAACRYVISEVKKAAPGLTIGMHTHNDLGLATANALAGVEAGASQVDVTINGVGARAGNATMAEVVVALESLYGISTGVDPTRLTGLANLFEELSNWPTPKDKALVGDYAFTDASDTHSFLMRADPLLFAPVTPEWVGNQRRSHLDLKSGVNTLRMRLGEIGLSVSEEALPRLWARIQHELEIKRRALTDAEIRACANAAQS